MQVRAVLREAREGGVTTMQDLTSADQLRAYQELQKRGELTSRIMLRPTLDNVTHARALGIAAGFGDEWLRFIGYKAWVDGIMGSSGAMFFEPYTHDPKNKGLRDIMRPEGQEGPRCRDRLPALRSSRQSQLDWRWRWRPACRRTFTPSATRGRIILDVYEKLLTKHDLVNRDHRWRVIRAQVVHPRRFHRFGKLRLVAVNPYHVSDDMRWMEERIGRERSRGATSPAEGLRVRC